MRGRRSEACLGGVRGFEDADLRPEHPAAGGGSGGARGVCAPGGGEVSCESE